MVPAICVVVTLVLLITTVIIPNNQYNDAVALMEAGKYIEAISAFESMAVYKKIAANIKLCEAAAIDGKYNDALALMDTGSYEEAIAAFEALNGYENSADKIQECQYAHAVTLMDNGFYEDALTKFRALDGYRDSTEKAEEAYWEYKIEKLQQANAGDCVVFGRYEQDDNAANGKEELEWLVLERNDNRLLVISKYVLDNRQYSLSDYYKRSWEHCELRTGLKIFMKSLFSAEEIAMIPTVTVPTVVKSSGRIQHSTKPGDGTQDQIFLLSPPEVFKYFDSANARQCTFANGTYNARWWLRSPEDNDFWAVDDDGSVSSFLGISNLGIRPALWIDLETIESF